MIEPLLLAVAWVRLWTNRPDVWTDADCWKIGKLLDRTSMSPLLSTDSAPELTPAMPRMELVRSPLLAIRPVNRVSKEKMPSLSSSIWIPAIPPNPAKSPVFSISYARP